MEDGDPWPRYDAPSDKVPKTSDTSSAEIPGNASDSEIDYEIDEFCDICGNKLRQYKNSTHVYCPTCMRDTRRGREPDMRCYPCISHMIQKFKDKVSDPCISQDSIIAQILLELLSLSDNSHDTARESDNRLLDIRELLAEILFEIRNRQPIEYHYHYYGSSQLISIPYQEPLDPGYDNNRPITICEHCLGENTSSECNCGNKGSTITEPEGQ